MRFGLREALFFMVLIAMVVSSYFFLFEPRRQQISEVTAETEQMDLELKQLDAALQEFEDLGAEIDRLSEAVTIFRAKLPEEQEVEVMLKEVWELAAQHKLTPKSVRTDKVVKTPHYAEMPIRMKIVGDFDGFYEFMLDLEKLRRITRLPTMKLKKFDGEEEGLMEAEVTLTIFFDTQADPAATQLSQGSK